MEIELTEADRAALKRAIDLTLAEDDNGRVAQMQDMMARDSWWEYATFASYHQQIRNLHLKPWQDPPMCGDIDDHDPKAAKLLRRMLKYGVSRFDPDPLKQSKKRRRPAFTAASCHRKNELARNHRPVP